MVGFVFPCLTLLFRHTPNTLCYPFHTVLISITEVVALGLQFCKRSMVDEVSDSARKTTCYSQSRTSRTAFFTEKQVNETVLDTISKRVAAISGILPFSFFYFCSCTSSTLVCFRPHVPAVCCFLLAHHRITRLPQRVAVCDIQGRPGVRAAL